ncbi:LolA family protein [Singulisphaera rosea]
MRRLVVFVGLLALPPIPSNTALGQATTPTQVEARPTDSRLKEILAQWEKRGPSKTLDVIYTKTETFAPQMATKSTQSAGRLLLKRPNLAWVDVDEFVGSNKKTFERMLWSGERLYHYRVDTHTIFDIPLSARDERPGPPGNQEPELRLLFATLFDRIIHGDRLPFLFDMTEADARRFYDMSLVREDDEVAVIKFTELTKDGKSSGVTATLELDKKLLLPRTVTHIKENQSTKVYTFNRVRHNIPVQDKTFQFTPLAGWKIEKVDATDAPEPMPKQISTKPAKPTRGAARR